MWTVLRYPKSLLWLTCENWHKPINKAKKWHEKKAHDTTLYWLLEFFWAQIFLMQPLEEGKWHSSLPCSPLCPSCWHDCQAGFICILKWWAEQMAKAQFGGRCLLGVSVMLMGEGWRGMAVAVRMGPGTTQGGRINMVGFSVKDPRSLTPTQ